MDPLQLPMVYPPQSYPAVPTMHPPHPPQPVAMHKAPSQVAYSRFRHTKEWLAVSLRCMGSNRQWELLENRSHDCNQTVTI